MSYSPVTIEEAKAIALNHELRQIVVWHFTEGAGQHVTTWGEPLKHSLQAAEAGNHVKRACGWPLEESLALPVWLGKVLSADARIELVAVCAKKMDDGLAPLVAAGAVHPEIARIMVADLRTAVLEKLGDAARSWAGMPRTMDAIESVTRPAEAEGSA